MRVREFAAGAVAIAVLTGTAAAQESVDVRRNASATGPLEVHVLSGEVELVGWGRNEVHVTGQLGRGAERIDVQQMGDRIVIRVHQSRNRTSGGTELRVRYPARRSLHVHTASAEVGVQAATGEVHVNTASGDVNVEGSPAMLEVNTRSGDVQLDGGTGRFTVNSISGNVQASGAIRGEAEVHTVSGDIQLRGPVGTLQAQSVSGSIQAERVGIASNVQTVSGEIEIGARTLTGEYNTVSGNIALTGSPAAGLEVHSHSGEVTLRLPRGADAELEITTWSGEIAIDFGGARLLQSSRRERQVRLGRGGPHVELSTFSGSVTVAEQ